MRVIKLLGVAAFATMVFVSNANALTTTYTGPGGKHITITKTGPDDFTITGPKNTFFFKGFGSGHGTWYKVPAVPEAETWAMMAVGLGLVGLRLRRKSKNAA
jgi:hypothetical protein